MRREEITLNDEVKAMQAVQDMIDEQIQKKGRGTFASIHEILGIMHEEQNEFLDEVHANNHGQIVKELQDIAVTAIWGIASIQSNKIDW